MSCICPKEEAQAQDVPERNDNLTRVVRMRIHRRKVIQNYDIYIGRKMIFGGRKLPESKWANPFRITNKQDRETVIKLYKEYLMSNPELMKCLGELKGKRLGCWCKPKRCHGDILAELANKCK